jgi:TonB family protein
MKRITSVCMVLFVGLVSYSIGQEAPKVINGGILNGKATSLPRPEYPAEARAAGLEGTVFVDVVIDESGAVMSAVAATDARKTRSVRAAESGETEVPAADPLLREAAERAALEARFSPTQLSGVPVKVLGTITYNFVLRGSASDIKGGVLNGKAISLPMPAYPEAARAVRAAGMVVVNITIDENGDVESAAAVSGHPLLRAAAVEAATAAQFAPTLLSGQPIKVSGVLTYNFVP